MFKSLVLAFLAVSAVKGASISTFVSCYADNGPTVTGTSDCRTAGYHDSSPPGSIYNTSTQSGAHADATYTLNSTGFSVRLFVSVNGYYFANGHAEANFSDQLYTAGPVRTGIVKGSNTYDRFVYSPASASQGATFTGKGPYDQFGPAAPTMYITLGQPFYVNAFAKADSSNGNGITGVNLQLNFFEADGITPVAISDVPEPGTLGFLALAGFGCLLRKRSCVRVCRGASLRQPVRV